MNKEYEKINQYLDWYENLLTEKQSSVMNMYFRENYSLSEIAEYMQISRSAVSDLIKRVSNTLEKYEVKLNLVAKFNLRNKCYQQLKEINHVDVKRLVTILINNE